MNKEHLPKRLMHFLSRIKTDFPLFPVGVRKSHSPTARTPGLTLCKRHDPVWIIFYGRPNPDHLLLTPYHNQGMERHGRSRSILIGRIASFYHSCYHRLIDNLSQPERYHENTTGNIDRASDKPVFVRQHLTKCQSNSGTRSDYTRLVSVRSFFSTTPCAILSKKIHDHERSPCP